MSEETKKIVIELTNRRPVKIDPTEWPIIAKFLGDSYRGWDAAVYEQAKANDEFDEYWLKVRQNSGGSVLIYGSFDAGERSVEMSRSGGILLEKPSKEEELIQGIRQVGENLQLPEYIIAGCISSLAPEEI